MVLSLTPRRHPMEDSLSDLQSSVVEDDPEELTDAELEILAKITEDVQQLNQRLDRIHAAYKASSIDEKLDLIIKQLEEMLPTSVAPIIASSQAMKSGKVESNEPVNGSTTSKSLALHDGTYKNFGGPTVFPPPPAWSEVSPPPYYCPIRAQAIDLLIPMSGEDAEIELNKQQQTQSIAAYISDFESKLKFKETEVISEVYSSISMLHKADIDYGDGIQNCLPNMSTLPYFAKVEKCNGLCGLDWLKELEIRNVELDKPPPLPPELEILCVKEQIHDLHLETETDMQRDDTDTDNKAVEGCAGCVAAKLGMMEPCCSVKDRIGYNMISDAEEVSLGNENENVNLDCLAIGMQFAAEEISVQRTATKDGGRIAGLESHRIINEPVAASFTYVFEKKNNERILVLDQGGGTFEVAVLEVGDGVFEGMLTSGNTHLRGDDFDKRIVDWLAERFKSDESIDLLKDKQALQRLTEAAKKAKMELSTLTQTNIILPFIVATSDGHKHIDTTLTRAKFEELCADLLDRLRTRVETALKNAKLSVNDVDEMILVGGSGRISAVHELVRKMIRSDPNVTVTDEALAPPNWDEIGTKLPPNYNGSETVHMTSSILAGRRAGEGSMMRCSFFWFSMPRPPERRLIVWNLEDKVL